jgi:hypothetical protein
VSHIGNAPERRRAWSSPPVAQLFGVVHLRSHQPQDQLVIGLVKPGESTMFDAWMALTRSGMVTPEACSRQVGNDMKLRHLAALHGTVLTPWHAIQRRLQIVGGDLPKRVCGTVSEVRL